MKTHIERLPEFYPSTTEDLALADWLKQIHPVNRLPKDWDQERGQRSISQINTGN